MKYTVTAVIPVAQYANVQPTIEVEAESWDEAKKKGDEMLREVWGMYCEPGKELRGPSGMSALSLAKTVKLKSAITGGEADFSEDNHSYIADGRVLLSGSAFADQYKHPFMKAAILPKMEGKYGIDANRISHSWDLKSEISTDFGHAIHKAIELVGKYGKDYQKMEKGLLDNPVIKPIVESYFEAVPLDNSLHEAFVMDADKGICGMIDRFQILDKEQKTCNIRDMKTNGDLTKQGSPKQLKEPFAHLPNTPLGGYHLQQNFYADIVEAAGWKVNKIFIDHLTADGWKKYEIEREQVTNVLEEK